MWFVLWDYYEVYDIIFPPPAVGFVLTAGFYVICNPISGFAAYAHRMIYGFSLIFCIDGFNGQK